jgi:hypothetical protein
MTTLSCQATMEKKTKVKKKIALIPTHLARVLLNLNQAHPQATMSLHALHHPCSMKAESSEVITLIKSICSAVTTMM